MAELIAGGDGRGFTLPGAGADHRRQRIRGPTASGGRGFTLLELLIALAILAVVSVAVLGGAGETVRQLGALERKTQARWLAEDTVAKLRLARARGAVDTGTTRNRVTSGANRWLVQVETTVTSHELLYRAEVSVFIVQDGREVGPVDALTAFLGKH